MLKISEAILEGSKGKFQYYGMTYDLDESGSVYAVDVIGAICLAHNKHPRLANATRLYPQLDAPVQPGSPLTLWEHLENLNDERKSFELISKIVETFEKAGWIKYEAD